MIIVKSCSISSRWEAAITYRCLPATLAPELLIWFCVALQVGDIRYSSFSPQEHGFTAEVTHCAVMDQYIFEVTPKFGLDADHLVSVTILPSATDSFCHGDYPGRPMKQVHEDVAAKLDAQSKECRPSGLAWVENPSPPTKQKPKLGHPKSAKVIPSPSSDAAPEAANIQRKDVTLSSGSGIEACRSSSSPCDDPKVPGDNPATSPMVKPDQKRKQQAVLLPRQTETSRLRKDKSHFSRGGIGKKTPEPKKQLLPQTRHTPTSSSSASRRKPNRAPTVKGSDHTVTSNEELATPTSTSTSGRTASRRQFSSSRLESPSLQDMSGLTTADLGQKENSTIQQYAGAFSASKQLSRSPPPSISPPHKGLCPAMYKYISDVSRCHVAEPIDKILAARLNYWSSSCRAE